MASEKGTYSGSLQKLPHVCVRRTLSVMVMVMVMVTFATASVLALVLDRNPLLCNQTVCGIGKLSALVTNELPPL